MATTIQISDEVWQKLNSMKKKRGDTFEDVLIMLLKLKKTKITNENI